MLFRSTVMPLNLFLIFIIFLTIIQSSCAERRITDGQLVTTPKRYMVYLIKAPTSSRKYDYWLCGGAIVSPVYIITSAACIEDVQYMYAIAGLNRYVKTNEVDSDVCTRKRKKRIVYSCVPKVYDFDFDMIQKWALIDIGVVRVESPYDFTDKSYETDCSYTPTSIPVNYELKYQNPGLDAIVLGFGHKRKWREPSDTSDYNQDQMNYASTLIEENDKCKKKYKHIPGMDKIIDKYMICTNDAGNIDDTGNLIKRSQPNECIPKEKGTESDESRKNMDSSYNITRRHGICQNDHGGPLVTWVGTNEILIGVASVFRVDDNSMCEGSYLYTSTYCTGIFLDCVINHVDPTRTNLSFCDKPAKEKGFDLIHRTISWKNQPEGPAENEFKLRPMIPIRDI